MLLFPLWTLLPILDFDKFYSLNQQKKANDNNNSSIPRPLSTLLETRLVVWPLCAVHHRPPSQGEVAAAAAAAAAADGIDWFWGPAKE